MKLMLGDVEQQTGMREGDDESWISLIRAGQRSSVVFNIAKNK